MKTLKIILILSQICLLLLFTNSVFAQENRFSAGVELALPMGDFADAAGIGFGASLRYEIPLGEQLGVMATLGYLSFTEEEPTPGYSFQTAMIPIQIGLKYYFMESQDGFYAAVQTGVHLFSTKVETPEVKDPFGNIIFPAVDDTETSTEFSIAPGIGYHLENVDVGLRYQLIFTEGESTSYLGLRLAYVFGSR